MGATVDMLQFESPALTGRLGEMGISSNNYKQTIGPNGAALRVNFDYSASFVRGSTRRDSHSGSNAVGVSSSLKGEATETRADKNGHLDTPTTSIPHQRSASLDHPAMTRPTPKPFLSLADRRDAQPPPFPEQQPPLQWDWDIEHEDRRRERRIDASIHHEAPFEVDRRLLKDVVREKMAIEVGRIKFLSAGTFHKAYLVILINHEELVARVARRFMPRLKTESEVATLSYLREKTNVPVPKIYHYDSNPYNRLGGEFILMSKAPGIPLSRVYHGLPYNDLVKLVKNLARIILPLFAHRFSDIGSLYFGPNPQSQIASGTPTPKATQYHYSGFPFSPTLGVMSKTPSSQSVCTLTHDYHVGPIISWPFFGSNRGELTHPTELNRGPWPSLETYVESCVDREIKGVVRENEGRSAPHRLHLDPDEIRSSRHHRLRAVPGDESDDSDEYNMEESDEEWEGPGDTNYSDFRRMQRSTFLVAHMNQREEAVRREMGRWKGVMDRLVKLVEKDRGKEEFALDCHDLSLENVFVDPEDNSKITCIIDWESTTTRPLWAGAHVPTCIQSSAFVSKLFRAAVAELPSDPNFRASLPHRNGKTVDPVQLCREWLHYEAHGARLRMAHRCAEWDGWEEGLVDSLLGPEEFENEWFKAGCTVHDHHHLKAMLEDHESHHPMHHHTHQAQTLSGGPSRHGHGAAGVHETPKMSRRESDFSGAGGGGGPAPISIPLPSASLRGSGLKDMMMMSPTTTDVKKVAKGKKGGAVGVGGVVGVVPKIPLPPFVAEQQKERLLNQTGDICGGRGGELGLRLEAWLSETGGVQQVNGGRLGKVDERWEEDGAPGVVGFTPSSSLPVVGVLPRFER